MKLDRRQVLGLTAGAAVLAVSGIRVNPASAAAEETKKRVMEFSGGKEPASGKITLKAPEIAENGNTVPIAVSVESAMSGDDRGRVGPSSWPKAIRTRPWRHSTFTELSGEASATTRMRLGEDAECCRCREDEGRIGLFRHQAGQGHNRRLRRLRT